MRKLSAALLIAGAARRRAPAGAATTKTVKVVGSAFSPKTVTVTAGDTVSG